MKLRHDPYRVFRFSKTPAGLYARQKWFGEADTEQWKVDYQAVVNTLLADQLPDGSWHQSTIETIKRLFGLHLTVRESNINIDNALAWLLRKINLQEDTIHVDANELTTNLELAGLPFIPSRPSMLLTGATLFLSTIFGRWNDTKVLDLYHWLDKMGCKDLGRWFGTASSHNILRAMVVHPEFSKSSATALAVDFLSGIQTSAGDWEPYLPFYQTLNAIAHTDLPSADRQLEKAFSHLAETQNEDGTWGRSEPEWDTFLTIHAMRNKGLL